VFRLAKSLTLAVVVCTATARADDTVLLRYKYSPGQVLQYEGKQTMMVESTVAGTTRKLDSATNSVRQWRVLSVDAQGNARLSLSLIRAQVDATTPDGKKIAFDTERDANSPLADVVGMPLVEVVLSPAGQVVSFGQPKTPAAGHFAAYLRTVLFPMPAQPVKVGATWQHELTLPLPPPVGRDESVRIRQAFRLEKLTESIATINLESTLAEEVKDQAVMERVAQFLPKGRFEFDLPRGVVRSLELNVDQKVTEFAGKGSQMTVAGSERMTLTSIVAGKESDRPR